ncbi:hypothetical protein [Sphingopyxis flava]|uniref:Uncharacterized protein n=1 Tax=Sphingopyxis flava TaxID=1507287 RepID=A0A1T5DPF0_9SPHN|nr:hypothetical protein [Sphingopyxis flava]SKB73535.1 hypothetical protein SAMN06295937_1015104 [Sphingopyxis flava]
MNRPDSRDDGTQSGPGEQIRPREKPPVSHVADRVSVNDARPTAKDRAAHSRPASPEGGKK